MMMSERPKSPVGIRFATARVSQRQVRRAVRMVDRDVSAKCPELCAFIQYAACSLCRAQFVAKWGRQGRLQFFGGDD